MRWIFWLVFVLSVSSPLLAQEAPPFNPLGTPARWFKARSSQRPLTVWFARRTDRNVARRVLRLLERAWTLQVEGLGFRAPLPYDPSGEGRYHVFVARGAGTEVTSQRRAPGVGHDAWETYMTIDAWGPYGGEVLAETTVHEFNHALQASDDWWESPGFFEMSATWVQEKHYPARNDYLSHIGDFQRRADLPPDHDDGYETWFMYGASLYLFFLEDRYFADDPRWLGRLWRGARNPPDAENEPDWIDALEARLPAGTAYADTVVAFARWRYYTGSRSDGAHFHDGHLLGPEGMVPIRHTIASAPRTLRSRGPRLLGTEYVRLRPPAGAEAVRVRLRGDPRVRFAVQVVPGLNGSDGEWLSADGRVVFGPHASRTLVVTATPKGSYDPDAHLSGRLRYRLRVTPVAPSTGAGGAAGLVGAVD